MTSSHNNRALQLTEACGEKTCSNHHQQSLKWAYDSVFARRLHYETLLWQVPSMSFTGQAFLFTIALSSTSSTAARVISMSISILISYLTAGTFAKHSLMENADFIWLVRAEEHLFPIGALWVGVEGNNWRPHGRAHIDMAWPDRHDIWRAPILKRSAKGNAWLVHNWIWGIRFMLATAGAILVISIVRPDWINVPNL